MTTDALALTVLTVLVVYGLCLAVCDFVSWLMTKPEREQEMVTFKITMDNLRGWQPVNKGSMTPPRPTVKEKP